MATVTGRLFSSIALDQRHEQLNKILKGAGGKLLPVLFNSCFSISFLICISEVRELYTVCFSPGLVGLTEKPSSMQKLIVNAPEIADIISKFEGEVLNLDDPESGLHHHFDCDRARFAFKKDTAALKKYFENAG